MIITLITNGLLLVKDSSVLLQARCCCTGGVGVCGRMWSGQYTLSLPTVYAAVYDKLQCEFMCVVHVQSFIGCGYGWCGT